MPVDKDRYIDFKWEDWYEKINYPYLFRLGVNSWEELNTLNIKNNLEDYLSQYDSIIWEKLFDYLKSQENLVWIKWNYIDTLSFGIYWNNLWASWKYKFVFEAEEGGELSSGVPIKRIDVDMNDNLAESFIVPK